MAASSSTFNRAFAAGSGVPLRGSLGAIGCNWCITPCLISNSLIPWCLKWCLMILNYTNYSLNPIHTIYVIRWSMLIHHVVLHSAAAFHGSDWGQRPKTASMASMAMPGLCGSLPGLPGALWKRPELFPVCPVCGHSNLPRCFGFSESIGSCTVGRLRNAHSSNQGTVVSRGQWCGPLQLARRLTGREACAKYSPHHFLLQLHECQWRLRIAGKVAGWRYRLGFCTCGFGLFESNFQKWTNVETDFQLLRGVQKAIQVESGSWAIWAAAGVGTVPSKATGLAGHRPRERLGSTLPQWKVHRMCEVSMKSINFHQFPFRFEHGSLRPCKFFELGGEGRWLWSSCPCFICEGSLDPFILMYPEVLCVDNAWQYRRLHTVAKYLWMQDRFSFLGVSSDQWTCQLKLRTQDLPISQSTVT